MKKLLFAALLVLSVVPQARAQDDDKKKLADAVAAAKAAIAAEKYEDAENALAGVAKLVHENAEAVLLRAKANFGMGEFGKCGTFAARATDLDPKNYDAHFLVGKAHCQEAEGAKSDKLASGGKVNAFFEQAVAAFDKALALKADDPEALEWKGYALYGQSKAAESIAVLEKLVALKPDNSEYFFALARSHVAAENQGKAVETVKKGLMAKNLAAGFGGDLMALVSDKLLSAGKFAETYELAKAWATAHANDPLAYLWMGYVRGIEKNDDEAITNYTKCFELSGKNHAGAALELGMAHGRKNEPAKAGEWFATAMKLQAEWPDPATSPLSQLNRVAFEGFLQNNEFAKGTEFLEKYALPAGESDWHTMNNLGLAYRDWADSMRGKRDEARAKNEKSLGYYEKAAKLVQADPNASPSEKAGVVNDLGVIHHYNLGNMEKGIEFYRKALALNPTWIDALENLGKCMNKLGKYEEAIPLFEKVLAQDPKRRVSLDGLSEAKKNSGK